MQNVLTHLNRSAIGLLLGLLIMLSRPYPLSGIIHLADVTHAALFIGGFIGLGYRWFGGFVALAVTLDMLSIASGTDPFCLSPAYGFLLPAFAVIWYAGAACGNAPVKVQLPLGLAGFSLAQVTAFFISSGSFYFLSGKFVDPTLTEMLARTERYLPGYFSSSFIYVALFLTLAAAFALINRRQGVHEH
ncbi:hypothetical protein [Litorivivens sp.]|uniref:hypothetical protein n=1 Tax=Litorivivens sp. TaxID=2020868 RepID=UPI00356A1856